MGYKEIKNGVENRGWIIYTSDKSGKLVLDTYENFVRCMEPHYSDHQETSMENVSKAEDKLNLHSKNISKILSLGKNAGHNQKSRCQMALKVVDSGVPDLDGLRKDHKKFSDPVKGPPLRPLCNGNIGPNAPLGNILSNFVKVIRTELADKIGTEAINSEVVLNMFDRFNSMRESRLDKRSRLNRNCRVESTYECQELDKWILGSMDVRALYPSITIKLAQEAIIESIKR